MNTKSVVLCVFALCSISIAACIRQTGSNTPMALTPPAARVTLVVTVTAREESRYLPPIHAVSFSADGQQISIVVGEFYRELWVFDAQGRRSLTTTLSYGNSQSFSADGRRLLTGDEQGNVIVYDVQTGKEASRYDASGEIRGGIAANADESRFAALDLTGKVYVLDGENGKILNSWQLPQTDPRYAYLVDAVSISPDGHYVIAAAEHNLYVFDADTGHLLWNVLDPCKGESSCISEEGIHYATISPDGQRIATAGRVDTDVRIWDARTGQMLVSLPGHASGGVQALFSPDGQRLVTTERLGTVRIWEVQSGKQLASMGRPGRFPKTSASFTVWAVAFSPDGERLMTGGEDGMIRIWNVATGEELSVIPAE